MSKVLVCRCALLPHSETFIKEQILAYSRWEALLVGTHQVSGVSLNGLATRLLYDSQGVASVPTKAYRKLLGQLNVAPRAAIRRLEDQGASLIHVHFGTDAVLYWPFIRNLGLPIFITLHGYDIQIARSWWESGAGGWLMRNYPHRLLALSRHPKVRFVAVSDAIRERAIAYGIPAAKVTTLHIGIDCKKFAPGPCPVIERPPRVLFVGRLVEKKGCEYLIRAMKVVQEGLPGAELVVAGDGALRAALEQLGRELRVKVMFLGSVTSSRVQAELANARALCLPSVRAANGDAEGLGIVLLEAQAAGVPVITSAVGGAQEGILEGETGYSFAEQDVASLSEKIIRVLTDDTLASSMSRAAPRFIAEQFDIRRLTARLESLYDAASQGTVRAGLH
jgi:glycosyltransferase involved in cell wall biosynthesis